MTRADRYVDGTYAETNPDWHESDAPWKASRVVAVLERAGVEPGRLCDIGCGTGGVLDELIRLLPDLDRPVGYDVAEEAVALAPPDRRERVELAGNTMDDGRTFDVALLLDVIEHVDDYHAFLATCRPKATVFVFHVPLDLHVPAMLRPGYLDKLRRLIGHIHYFTAQTAVSTLEDAGFTVVHRELSFPAIERPVTWRQRVVAVPRRIVRFVSASWSARLLGGATLWVVARPGA